MLRTRVNGVPIYEIVEIRPPYWYMKYILVILLILISWLVYSGNLYRLVNPKSYWAGKVESTSLELEELRYKLNIAYIDYKSLKDKSRLWYKKAYEYGLAYGVDKPKETAVLQVQMMYAEQLDLIEEIKKQISTAEESFRYAEQKQLNDK